MLNGVGFIIILGCVFGSFILGGGKMGIILEALPHELMAIGGADSFGKSVAQKLNFAGGTLALLQDCDQSAVKETGL